LIRASIATSERDRTKPIEEQIQEALEHYHVLGAPAHPKAAASLNLFAELQIAGVLPVNQVQACTPAGPSACVEHADRSKKTLFYKPLCRKPPTGEIKMLVLVTACIVGAANRTRSRNHPASPPIVLVISGYGGGRKFSERDIEAMSAITGGPVARGGVAPCSLLRWSTGSNSSVAGELLPLLLHGADAAVAEKLLAALKKVGVSPKLLGLAATELKISVGVPLVDWLRLANARVLRVLRKKEPNVGDRLVVSEDGLRVDVLGSNGTVVATFSGARALQRAVQRALFEVARASPAELRALLAAQVSAVRNDGVRERLRVAADGWRVDVLGADGAVVATFSGAEAVKRAVKRAHFEVASASSADLRALLESQLAAVRKDDVRERLRVASDGSRVDVLGADGAVVATRSGAQAVGSAVRRARVEVARARPGGVRALLEARLQAVGDVVRERLRVSEDGAGVDVLGADGAVVASFGGALAVANAVRRARSVIAKASSSTTNTAQVRPVLKRNQPIECFVVRRGAVTAKPKKRGPSSQTLFQLSALTSADLEPVTMAHVRSTALEGSFALGSDIFVVAVDESLDMPIDDVGERCRAQAHPKVVDSIGSVQRPDEDGYFYAHTSQHWAPGYGQRKRAGDAEFAKWNWGPMVVNAELHGLLGCKTVRQMRRIVDNVASPCGIDAYVYVLHSGALAHKFWFLQYYRNANSLEAKPYAVAPKRSQSANAKRSAPVPAAPLETQSQKMFFTTSVPATDGPAFFAQAAMMPPPPPSSASAALASATSALLAAGAQSSDGAASGGLLSSTTTALFQSHTNGNVGSVGAFPIYWFVRSSSAEQFGATSVNDTRAVDDNSDSGVTTGTKRKFDDLDD
jgi:hypothetical protein